MTVTLALQAKNLRRQAFGESAPRRIQHHIEFVASVAESKRYQNGLQAWLRSLVIPFGNDHDLAAIPAPNELWAPLYRSVHQLRKPVARRCCLPDIRHRMTSQTTLGNMAHTAHLSSRN
jgi:hypothetical protein